MIISEGKMNDENKFSIDKCCKVFRLDQQNLYKKCCFIYLLSDDLIEEKYDWLTGFIPIRLLKELKKKKLSVRRGILFRSIKMALESAMGGAVMREIFMEKLPAFLPRSSKFATVSWASCPEVRFVFGTSYRDREGEHACLSEHDCFLRGITLCLDTKRISPANLAAEYDIFYHTRYPERAKEFDVFVNKVVALNHLNPTLLACHNDKLPMTNDWERTIE